MISTYPFSCGSRVREVAIEHFDTIGFGTGYEAKPVPATGCPICRCRQRCGDRRLTLGIENGWRS